MCDVCWFLRFSGRLGIAADLLGRGNEKDVPKWALVFFWQFGEKIWTSRIH